MLKWQGSPEMAWGFLFFCPDFSWQSQFFTELRKTFHLFITGAPDSQYRMTPAQDLRPLWILGCLPPLWPQHCIHFLNSCFVNLEVNSDASVQFSSVAHCVWLFATTWTTEHQASLSITNSWSLLRLMPIESVMPSNHLILCLPLLLLPAIFPNIRVFSNESVLRIRWPKYWSFSFNISPSNEHPGLISFRMDWLDLLADEGTLMSLLQNDSSKASILQHSAFFIVQLSHPYMTTGKTTALTRRTFVGKVMSLPLICTLGWS